ncbi:MAG: TolC family protein [Elusimicrobia bacterium]|nr:TolC family protein [Elusimicrobiota bacterium]
MALGLVVLAAALAGPCRAETSFTQESYLRLALENSPELRSAEAAAEAASAKWKEAVGDAWLPALSAEAQAAPWGKNPLHSDRFSSWRLNGSDVKYDASLSLNLFNSFLDSRKIRQAALSRDLSRARLDEVRQDRALQAVKAYLDLALKQGLKEVADSDLEAQKAQYLLTQDLYKNGMKSKSDLLKSETDWRSSELRAFAAEAERRKSLYRFNVLISRDPEEPSRLESLVPPEPLSGEFPASARKAVLERPEMRQAELALAQARTSAASALQKLFPTLSAAAHWSAAKAATFGDPSLGTGRSRPNYYLGVSLSLPAGFNGFSQWQERASAAAELRKSREDREALVRRVREEVYVARINFDLALNSFRLGRQRQDIARDNLELVTQQYRQGSADVIRLAQARQDYLQSRVELERLLHDSRLGWIQYRQAVGEPLWGN